MNELNEKNKEMNRLKNLNLEKDNQKKIIFKKFIN